MPEARVNGVRLYYDVAGSGSPLVFVHEFAGDSRSWDPQVRFFARRYQTITYNARGYPPSEVPEDPAAYSQDAAVEDLRCLILHLDLPRRTCAAYRWVAMRSCTSAFATRSSPGRS